MTRNRHNGALNRHDGRRIPVPRKPEEEWAVLAVPQAKLKKRAEDRQVSVRTLADLCGHKSHSHIWRLMNDEKVKTTSIHTAGVLEAVLDARGLLFARTSARTGNRVAA